jgi:dTDP-4-dehydrorhamnose reductase
VKLVVTGAAGMLARALVPALKAAGHDVVAPAEAELDVTQRPAALLPTFRAQAADWVIHLAAFTRVDDCENRVADAFAVNAGGSLNVALAAREAGAGVLTVSTDYVFDGRGTRPYREDDPAAPVSVYGRSKWLGEEAVRAVTPRHLIVRTAWLYGKGGPNFVDGILGKARSGEALRVVDDQRGSPTWTEDLAAGLVRLLAGGCTGTFHCTNSGDCTWYDLAAHVVERAGLRVDLARSDSASLGRPAPRPAYSVLDSSRFESATGWRMPPWQKAVDRYLGVMAQGPGRNR